MGVKRKGFDELKAKLAGFFDHMEPDLEWVGEVMAQAIVQTTLAGVGEKDQLFAPYSDSYRAVLEKAGGKPNGLVNLRGLFYPPGVRRGPKAKRRLVSYPVTAGGRSFTVTRQLRPQRGVVDANSELSADLIRAKASGHALKLTYTPRKKPYMLFHQAGEGKNPRRPWFTANKAAVKAAALQALRQVLAARVEAFNRG